jgi:hypothetical protein
MRDGVHELTGVDPDGGETREEVLFSRGGKVDWALFGEEGEVVGRWIGKGYGGVRVDREMSGGRVGRERLAEGGGDGSAFGSGRRTRALGKRK